MPLDQDNQHRRKTDLPPGQSPTLNDVWKLLNEIKDRLDDLERSLENITTAFPIDDLKRPDYDGHRKQHVEMKKADELMDSYKHDATKQIIVTVVTFFAGLIASGFVAKFSGYLK